MADNTSQIIGHRPSFLFIGPDKSGSTWLYEVLRQHPECFVPRIKDIYFFDRYYSRGMKWYLGFFSHAPPEAKALGELSHGYLFSQEAAKRIARDLPDVRLLTCLRDPVERTISHYLYLRRSGITRASLEIALQDHPELITNSLYHRHLRVYLELFPADRLLILLFSDLCADPAAFAAQVFRFLNVREVEGIDYSMRVLPASRARSYLLARFLKQGALLARELGIPELVGVIKRNPVTQLLYPPYAAGGRPVVDPATRDRLRSLFRSDVEALRASTSLEVQHWLEPDERDP